MSRLMSKWNTAQYRIKIWFIRIFAFSLISAILIDTIPSFITAVDPIQKPLNRWLGCLGLSQGDWPLFAPNPVLNNGTLVAEVTDHQDQLFRWTSPEWSQKKVIEKFLRFREMNYFQRLPRYSIACEDFTDYLFRAIPDKEPVAPMLSFELEEQSVKEVQLRKPLKQITLYHADVEMLLTAEEPLPSFEETTWSYPLHFLVRRERKANDP